MAISYRDAMILAERERDTATIRYKNALEKIVELEDRVKLLESLMPIPTKEYIKFGNYCTPIHCILLDANATGKYEFDEWAYKVGLALGTEKGRRGND